MNSSNRMAQDNLDDACIRHRVFPNLARRRPPSQSDIEQVSGVCKGELLAAGIRTVDIPHDLLAGEVPSLVMGDLSGWRFERRWYYWIAIGPGIPPDIAEELHARFGKEVRVAGHCTCPSPLQWFHGFAVGSYHVDTQEGLNALAETLRSIWNPDVQR